MVGSKSTLTEVERGTRGWRGGVVGSKGGLEDGEGEWSAVRVD